MCFFAPFPLINNSVLLDSVDYISTARLSSINFNNVDILKIMKSLNVDKAHSRHDISVRMIKFDCELIVKPSAMKKFNIIHVHKKGDKQIIDNQGSDYHIPVNINFFQ